MKVKATLTAILAFAAIGLIADLAIAKEIPIGGHSKSQVQAGCQGKGDVFWTNGGPGHDYGCLKGDGSLTVCGGVTPQQKKTCSTSRTASFPPPTFPTRADAEKVEK
jgi:hypothetical protein